MATRVLPLLLILFFVAAKPFSGVALNPLSAFVPFYVTAIFLNDLITSVLLFAQFTILRTRSMLLVANGYLFAAIMLIPYTISFPGVFLSGSAAGTLQSTPWLYIFRHCGLALFLAGYGWAEGKPQAGYDISEARRITICSVMATVGVVCLAGILCIGGYALLPTVIDDARRFSSVWPLYAGLPIACCYLLALKMLWPQRGTILGLWLSVVALVHLAGVPLSFYPNPQRFSVGWYAVIIINLLANTLVLVVLLFEFSKLYARVLQAVHAQYLEREARLVTGDAVAAMISHDVKQPLSAMITRAEAGLRRLERTSPDIEKAKQDIRQVAADGHRAAEVIDGIRANFKKEARTRSVMNLTTLIDETLALMRAELQRNGVSVENGAKGPAALVLGDRTQLQQVILNLCLNAIDAMAKSKDPKLISIGLDATIPDEVRLSISDTGPGIAKENAERVFNPLYSTKADGMGMGLSICRSIVESHDGRICVAPARGKGATFEIVLPVVSRPGPDVQA